MIFNDVIGEEIGRYLQTASFNHLPYMSSDKGKLKGVNCNTSAACFCGPEVEEKLNFGGDLRSGG